MINSLKSKFRKINFPLFLGSIILIFLILMAFKPQLFTDKDPVFEESPRYVEYKVDGKIVEKLSQNPMPPNEENIFGTDDGGRDVYARLVYGTRNTMRLALFTAIFRMLLALPFGVAAGIGLKFASSIIKVFNTFFTAIPMLVFSFIVLNISYFGSLQIDKAIIAFTIVLTLVGWGKLGGIIEDSTRLVMDEDFIEGEIAIGKTKFQIAYQNIVPHIVPESISLFFKEIGLALFLIAQLAILYVFVGVTRQIHELAFRANYIMALEPEWGASLSRIAQNIKAYDQVYWMILYPVLAFTIAIVGINLIGEGLRIEFQKRDSRVISSMRKILYAISPKIFIYQIKSIKKYYKPVIIKITAIAVIVAYILIPWNPSKYDFNIAGAKVHLEELVDSKYKGRASGTEGGYLAGEYIIETLESYGYDIEIEELPLGYTPDLNPTTGLLNVKEIDYLSPMIIEEGWIKLTDNEEKEKIYNLHEDFTIMTISEEIFKNGTNKELNYKGIAANLQNADKVEDGEEFFNITGDVYGYHALGTDFIKSVTTSTGKTLNYDIQFVMEEGYNPKYNSGLFKFTTIVPFDELRKDLQSGYSQCEINLDFPKAAEYPGRNIIATLPGEGKTLEEPGELVIIGASYDGAYVKNGKNTYSMTAAPAATALELAKTISQIDEPLEKSVQFILWDNEYDSMLDSAKDGSYYFGHTDRRDVDMSMSHGYYYFDINYPGYTWDEKLNIITFASQTADSNNYLMGLEIQERLKEQGVKYQRNFYFTNSQGVNNMKFNSLSTIGVGNTTTWEINGDKDTLENINYKRIEEMGQIILDTITMNQYMLEK